MIEHATRLLAVEIKSGTTASSEFLRGLNLFRSALEEKRTPRIDGMVVYGGSERQTREGVPLVPWNQVTRIDWTG